MVALMATASTYTIVISLLFIDHFITAATFNAYPSSSAINPALNDDHPYFPFSDKRLLSLKC
jgi:hypothetical protein